MVKSATLRRIVISSSFILLTAISCTTVNSFNAPNLVRDFVQTIASILFFTSVALIAAIHRKYPRKHDKPEDIGELFCEGPYALCRHPLYFLLLLAQLSVPLFMTSLWGLVVWALFLPAWILFIKVEEKELIEYWGEKYVNYMKKTPMLIPFPHIFKSSNS